MDELRHQQQHNVIDPQHEKPVEEIVEVVQIISQKHFLSTVQLFNCDILFSSCCATRMTNLDEKLTGDGMRETI